VACSFRCRVLYHLPCRACVSTHHVQCNIPTFEALLWKNMYHFLERCRKSNNVWLRALMQSDSWASEGFFPWGKSGKISFMHSKIRKRPVLLKISFENFNFQIPGGKGPTAPFRRPWSDCLHSLFFEHYNRILLCNWVLGRYSVCLTACACHSTFVLRAGPGGCGAQCKTWARSPMQDLGAGPLWAVILWRHRVQSTVLRSW